MGCIGASVYQPAQFDNKILIWIIGGGPGSPKQHVITYLTQQYHFKYLSALQLIHFEEKASSPEAIQIRKNMEEKKQYSASLIIKLIKKFVSSYGPRKYLLDNFPRNQKDAIELDQFSLKYSNQVNISWYIQLDIEEQQMREDGIKTLKQLKKDQKDQNIQKQVRLVIQSYRNKIKPVHQYYKAKSLFSSFSFQNNDINLLMKNIDNKLAIKDINPVKNVSFYFVNSNHSQELKRTSLIMTRKFGFKYWSIQQLIQELKTYPQTAKQIDGKTENEVEGSLLVELMFRKLKRYNFKGKYLISGFPRTQADYQVFQGKFGGQTKVQLYYSFLKTPATQKQQQHFTQINKRLFQVQQINSKLTSSSETPLAQLQKCIDKTLPSIKKRQSLKVGLFPSLQNKGQQYAKKLMQWCEVIDFKDVLKEYIKKDSIYSDLLKSNTTLDQPVSGVIYSEIYKSKLDEYKGAKPLVFKNFPQNLEQLKNIIERSVEVITLFGLFVVDNDKQGSKGKKDTWRQSQYKNICNNLEHSCDKFFPIDPSKTYQQLKIFVDNL